MTTHFYFHSDLFLAVHTVHVIGVAPQPKRLHLHTLALRLDCLPVCLWLGDLVAVMLQTQWCSHFLLQVRKRKRHFPRELTNFMRSGEWLVKAHLTFYCTATQLLLNCQILNVYERNVTFTLQTLKEQFKV